MPGTELMPYKAVVSPFLMDHSHRCDRCEARAYVHTILNSGGELYWCRHHYLFYRHVLAPQVMYTNDETRQLFDGIKDDGHYIEGQEAHIPQRKTP